MASQEQQITRESEQAVVRHDPSQDWQILGETFEALGKAGLAVTVGFSVAAAFCKMVDSGKIKLPSVLSLLNEGEKKSSDRT